MNQCWHTAHSLPQGGGRLGEVRAITTRRYEVSSVTLINLVANRPSHRLSAAKHRRGGRTRAPRVPADYDPIDSRAPETVNFVRPFIAATLPRPGPPRAHHLPQPSIGTEVGGARRNAPADAAAAALLGSTDCSDRRHVT
ncbi:hypothetical protein EVAR_26641_1 [Eumeta japonica]|uniref:Uncharacterized protein n=1 Tax=Eumeta variegata TaxID=151549 RepID=A0A4C1VN30_EUMVA|nr:hypothetical protein EVAR_26641_1 [Eumeta japonica]